MNILLAVANELHGFLSSRLDEQTEYVVTTSMDCGEQGVATDVLLDWAIDNNVSIPEEHWAALKNFYADETVYGREYTLARLARVPHAA